MEMDLVKQNPIPNAQGRKRADNIMTVKDVAGYLKLAESTIYKLLREGKIPAKKVGGRWRFSRNLLDGWLQEGGKSSSGDEQRETEQPSGP